MDTHLQSLQENPLALEDTHIVKQSQHVKNNISIHWPYAVTEHNIALVVTQKKCPLKQKKQTNTLFSYFKNS